MTAPMFANLIRTREAAILLALACFILVLPIVNLFDSDFMRVSGAAGSVGLLDFLAGEFDVQRMLMLPMVVMIYLVADAIRTPIATGRMFLYKDLSRAVIIDAKILALAGVYALYMALQTAVTSGVYFLYITRFDYASGALLPGDARSVAADVVSIVGVLCADLVTMLVAAALATRFRTGIVMFGSILWLCLCATLPQLPAARYAVPGGYARLLPDLGLPLAMASMLVLTAAYVAGLYVYARRRFSRIEY
ncbi:hypothetical protein JS528_02165 [Bifidobacterium sp. MA2]|uniref:ABC-2 family transporter protein n=1 Tax=Bifidobacterium santillanense TaxID=2809028 RepID=A0ABS5UMN3_9BIFI|nr:hypothetical protein [Bifidobacterium santillanense]MBT1172182.1 hypothetical protein [Bifidobacterium santillanense]